MHERIISTFRIPGTLIRAGRFGSGLINETYLCEFSDAGVLRRYILQRINERVFQRPELVMENVETVTGHIQQRLRQQGVKDPENVTPALVRTKTGTSFHRNGAGGCWRMFHFIETGEVFDTVQSPSHAYEVGRGLGQLQALVSDLAPERLHDTLPGFHHTPVYLAQFDDAVKSGVADRIREAAPELAFVQARRPLARLLMDALESGRIPVRVVHNDPKVNNVMIHRETKKALCMVDLDTVKPGIVHFDFGDCVRSAANPAGEDASDLDQVALDRALSQAIRQGYLEEAGSFLTKEEIDLLPASIAVITFELGMRFLADFLRGDTYFRIKYPSHNLHRCRVQFRLLESIEGAGPR